LAPVVEARLREGAGEPVEPLDFARHQMNVARAILARDKHLIPTAWLKRADGEWEFHGLQPPEDDADKAAMAYLLEHAVRRTGATAIIHTAESWVGSVESLKKGLRASESPDRREAILVTVATRAGDIQTLASIFHKNLLGQVRFEPVIEGGAVRGSAGSFFAPILRVWAEENRRQPPV